MHKLNNRLCPLVFPKALGCFLLETRREQRPVELVRKCLIFLAFQGLGQFSKRWLRSLVLRPAFARMQVFCVLRHFITSLYALSFRILRKFACLMVLSRTVFLWGVEGKEQVGRKVHTSLLWFLPLLSSLLSTWILFRAQECRELLRNLGHKCFHRPAIWSSVAQKFTSSIY